MSEIKSIGTELPNEIERVGAILDRWIRMQAAMGPSSKAMSTGMALLKAKIDVAAKAIADGDTVQMVRSYGTLKAYKDHL